MNAKITSEDVIPILQKLITHKTINPPGITIDAVKYIEKILTEENIKVEIQEYHEGRANLIAEYGEGETSIILCGHIDVVPAGDEEKWTFPPFSGTVNDGKIYGRGATDMKGAVAAFLALILHLKKIGYKGNKKVKLLITSDEEIGMEGAKQALKTGVMDDCDFIVIGEPTELKIALAQKGIVWLKAKVRGKSAHGSTPHYGVNAILNASKFITQTFEHLPTQEHSLLGHSTLNIGQIKGGVAPNVVPEYCEVILDYRVIPGIDFDDMIEQIKQLATKFNNENDAKVEIEVMHLTRAIETTADNSHIESLIELCKENNDLKDVIGVMYGTDGAFLVPKNNTPFVIFGPGKLNLLHVTDEYTEIDEVVKYTNILLEMIENE